MPHTAMLRLHRGSHLRTAGLLAPDIADCLRGDTILHGEERGGLRRPTVLRKVDRDSVLWRDLAPASSQSEARVRCLLFPHPVLHAEGVTEGSLPALPGSLARVCVFITVGNFIVGIVVNTTVS
jgi:hypothetical protein